MRVAVWLAAALLFSPGCARPAPRPPKPVPAPAPHAERVVVLEAPEGSGLRAERPALLRVADARTGTPIEGAHVVGPGADETTAADGYCEVPGDEGKPRAWTVSADGYAPAVAYNIGRGRALSLRPAPPLVLQVIDTFGRTVANARVSLLDYLERPSRWRRGTEAPVRDFEVAVAHTDAGGGVRLAGAGREQLVRVAAPGHFTAEMPVRALPLGDHGRVIRIRQWPGEDFTAQSPLEPSGMDIEVTDAESLAPVPDLALRLESFEEEGRDYAARTGSDGVARVRCAAGEYGCLPRGPFEGYTFERVNVDASPDRQRFLVRAVRNPTLRVTIRGLPEPAVFTLGVEGAQRGLHDGEVVSVRAGLPMVLSVTAWGRDRSWPIAELDSGEALRSVTLEWGPASERAPSHGGAASPSHSPSARAGEGTVLVDIRDPRGRFLSGHAFILGRFEDRGSRITLRRVPAGPHRVVIWAEGREVLVEPVTVVAGATVRVLARLRPLE